MTTLVRGLAMFCALGMLSVGLYGPIFTDVVGVGGWALLLTFFLYVAVGYRWES